MFLFKSARSEITKENQKTLKFSEGNVSTALSKRAVSDLFISQIREVLNIENVQGSGEKLR